MKHHQHTQWKAED